MSQQPTQNPPLPQRPIPNVGAILTRAAWIIEQRGHCQGAFVAPIVVGGKVQEMKPGQTLSRPVCVAGAIRIATSGLPMVDHPSARAAIRFLSDVLPGEPPTDEDTGQDDYLEHVAMWNDQAGRSQAEVVVRLREVAILATGVAVAA